MALNILSEGTDVAGTAKTRFATMAICGNLCSFCFHHFRGSSSGLDFSARKHCSSSAEVLSEDS